MKLIDNSLKTNWKYVAIVVVLGLIVSGGIVWHANSPTPAPQPIEMPTVEKPPTGQALDTSTWQTYRNEEFGFEVRYLPQIFIKEVDEDSTYFTRTSFLTTYLDVSLKQNSSLPTEPPRGTIAIYVDDNPIWLERCLRSEVTSKTTPDEKISIDGVEFSVYDESNSASGGLRSKAQSYRVIQNGKCYRIQSSITWRSIEFYRGATDGPPVTQQEIQQEQVLVEAQLEFNNEILSTFRFVE